MSRQKPPEYGTGVTVAVTVPDMLAAATRMRGPREMLSYSCSRNECVRCTAGDRKRTDPELRVVCGHACHKNGSKA